MKKGLLNVLLLILILAIGPTITMGMFGNDSYVEAKTLPDNPVVKIDPDRGDKATYDCVWFGSYPQTEIVNSASSCGNYGKPWALNSDFEVNTSLYQTLENETAWDSYGDITLSDGTKYRRIRKSDAADANDSSEDCYDWASEDTYHYFRYEPIKWRVLETDGSTALLLADKVLDGQRYNAVYNAFTWETSTIRSWLNGYDASMNSDLTDFTDSSFINSAFTDEEKEGLISRTQDNKTTAEFADGDGGENTEDKVFLLSENDFQNDKYGFSKHNYEKNISKSTTYAKAMGIRSGYNKFLAACTSGWLRLPDSSENADSFVSAGGEPVYRYIGLRPACSLNLDLSSVYSYAGTVCSDGTMKQENDGDEKVHTYTVTYDANGGDMAPAKQTKTEGKKLILTGAAPKRRGYNFVGWSVSKSSIFAQFYPLWYGEERIGGEYYDDSDITLYAVWEKMVYNVDYDWNPKGTISLATDGYAVYFKGTGKLENTLGYIIDYNVDELYVEEGITSIGQGAFSGFTFKKVHLPDSLVTVEKDAFSESKIGEINIPKNLKTIGGDAFSAESVKKIKFDYGVKIIGGFGGVKYDKLVIPDTVTTIKEGAFNASSINTIEIPGSVKRIESHAFSMSHVKKIIFHEGLEYIGEQAFGECTKLQNIKLPNTVKTIENGAFTCCDAFTEIVVPGGVTKLGSFVFDSNYRLKTLTIENGVTEIPSYFCYGCDDLMSVSIPTSVTKIGNSAFECCENLNYIYIPDSTKSIGSYSLGFTNKAGSASVQSFAIDEDAGDADLVASSQASHIKIKGFVLLGKRNSAAEKYAKKYKIKFVADRDYKKKFVKNNLRYIISDYKQVTCYGSKTKLRTLNIPDKVTYKNKTYKVTTIAGGAFKNNRKLSKVTLGKNIKTIGAKAFYKCSGIKALKIKTKALKKTTIRANAFKGISKKMKVFVPKKKKQLYKKFLLKRGMNKKAKVVSY